MRVGGIFFISHDIDGVLKFKSTLKNPGNRNNLALGE